MSRRGRYALKVVIAYVRNAPGKLAKTDRSLLVVNSEDMRGSEIRREHRPIPPEPRSRMTLYPAKVAHGANGIGGYYLAHRAESATSSIRTVGEHGADCGQRLPIDMSLIPVTVDLNHFRVRIP
jgi:hypothetical protein